MPSDFPLYAALSRPDATGLPLAWGVWGPDDEIGMLNNITPEKAVEAAALVKEGRRFNMDLPLDLPWGSFMAHPEDERSAPRHVVTASQLAHLPMRDDHLQGFYLQGSSQWDGLTHMADPEHGFYNTPRQEGPLPIFPGRCGIDRVAEFGIFTRGVLADVERYFAAIGRPWSIVGGDTITTEELEACLAWQGTSLGPGDFSVRQVGVAHEVPRGRPGRTCRSLQAQGLFGRLGRRGDVGFSLGQPGLRPCQRCGGGRGVPAPAGRA